MATTQYKNTYPGGHGIVGSSYIYLHAYTQSVYGQEWKRIPHPSIRTLPLKEYHALA